LLLVAPPACACACGDDEHLSDQQDEPRE
jgi:hypothetical protein